MTTANEKLEFIKTLKTTQVTDFQITVIVNGATLPAWFSSAVAPRLKELITGEDAPMLKTLEKATQTAAKAELQAEILTQKAILDALKAKLDNLNLGGG
jgi:hypothetical protein